jgi:hypothetical protein
MFCARALNDSTRKKSGNRIIPARMPGVTATDTAHGKPQALDGAMPLKRLDGILRAGREKTTTTAEEWADRVLIDANQADQGP